MCFARNTVDLCVSGGDFFVTLSAGYFVTPVGGDTHLSVPEYISVFEQIDLLNDSMTHSNQ